MWTRTTGALESYNGQLGNRIQKRGHFFNFIKILLDEEFLKCREFYSRLDGRDDKPAGTKGTRYQIRGKKIMAYSQQLLEDRLTPDEFLNRIVYKQNNLDFGLMDTNFVSPIVDDEDEDDDDSEHANNDDLQSPLADTSEKRYSRGLCLTCKDAEAQLCILPCFDFCICEQCWTFLKSNDGIIKCPACSCICSDAKRMNFAN